MKGPPSVSQLLKMPTCKACTSATAGSLTSSSSHIQAESRRRQRRPPATSRVIRRSAGRHGVGHDCKLGPERAGCFSTTSMSIRAIPPSRPARASVPHTAKSSPTCFGSSESTTGPLPRRKTKRCPQCYAPIGPTSPGPAIPTAPTCRNGRTSAIPRPRCCTSRRPTLGRPLSSMKRGSTSWMSISRGAGRAQARFERIAPDGRTATPGSGLCDAHRLSRIVATIIWQPELPLVLLQLSCACCANDCIIGQTTGDRFPGGRMRQITISAVGTTLLMAASGFATAQDAASESTAATPAELQEVTVTAQKSGAQSLQSAPLAIQAFSGEDLKEKNITSIDDLVSSVPGAFEGQQQSVASRSYNLRGAGGSNANGDSPIGYYLDDVPFIVTNFGIAPPVRFIDIERVEVLRGPQGTLYGQGSSGGAFIFHTRDPDLKEFKFIGEAELGSTDGAGAANYAVSGAASIPLIQDRLAIRISGGHSYNPGWADEYYGPYDGTPDQRGVNGSRNDDIRVVALFAPTDNITFRSQYWRFRPRQSFTGFTTSVDPPYFDNTAGQSSFSNGDFELWSFTAGMTFEHFSITSATSDLKGSFGINIPLAPSGFFSSQFFPKMFAEELRAYSTGSGPWHWLLGAAYQDGQGPQSNELQLPGTAINADNNTL